MAKYNIGGYIFDDENKAKLAAKELRAVEYILAQLKDADERGVLTVYKKLLNQRQFSTEIGMSFLTQLRQNLLQTGAFLEDEIPPVYKLQEEEPKEATASVEEPIKEEPKEKEPKKASASTKVIKPQASDSSEIKKLKFFNRVLIVLCITLLLCVIGMFYVNSTINSPTILNYEQEILNKYAAWEQELTEREDAVKEKELKQQ
jgi:hypothetical protein